MDSIVFSLTIAVVFGVAGCSLVSISPGSVKETPPSILGTTPSNEATTASPGKTPPPPVQPATPMVTSGGTPIHISLPPTSEPEVVTDIKIECHTTQPCPEQSWVCGSDGISYVDRCSLAYANCLNVTDVSVARLGHCSWNNCNAEDCKTKPKHHTICGTDGKTYGSVCYFNRAQCEYFLVEKKLSVLSLSACPSGTVPRELPATNKKCRRVFTCHLKEWVCGTNGKTYYDICNMDYANCRDNINVNIVKFNHCSWAPNQPHVKPIIIGRKL